MALLAIAYLKADRNEEGLRLLEEALSIQRTTFGLKRQNTLRMMAELASALEKTRKSKESLGLLVEVLPLLESKLGPRHPVTLEAMILLGQHPRTAGRVRRSRAVVAGGPRGIHQASSRCFHAVRRSAGSGGPDEPCAALREIKPTGEGQRMEGAAGCAERHSETGE